MLQSVAFPLCHEKGLLPVFFGIALFAQIRSVIIQSWVYIVHIAIYLRAGFGSSAALALAVILSCFHMFSFWVHISSCHSLTAFQSFLKTFVEQFIRYIPTFAVLVFKNNMFIEIVSKQFPPQSSLFDFNFCSCNKFGRQIQISVIDIYCFFGKTFIAFIVAIITKIFCVVFFASYIHFPAPPFVFGHSFSP